ncbi:MAG: NUDIX hydrolase [Bacteroidetes bacterium SW_9_63_38]|nr:MAG: NUDIX hydrolase [Bacteroidetes bacterium SW_9_63_38]
MLLFYATDDTLALDAATEHGLSASSPIVLHTTLAAAQDAASGPVLVVDPAVLNISVRPNGPTVRVPTVPPAALANLAPYRPPTPVPAAGGYVVCPLPDDIALLLIHRRGVWDLPKGKQDPGEDIETCAQREVQEEVGIDNLQVLQELNTTQHGYPDGDTYAVKTTYWYLMRTSDRSFEPERREGIRRVAWARWAVAHRHMGYDTLRRHMDRVDDDVRTALADAAPLTPNR